MAQIDSDNRVFSYFGETLDYDLEGRLMLYDALSSNLQKRLGAVITGSSLLAFYMFYTTPTVYELTLPAVMNFGCLAWFGLVTMNQLSMMKERATKVNRMYLLQGGNTVRLFFNNGKVLDVPLTGIQ